MSKKSHYRSKYKNKTRSRMRKKSLEGTLHISGETATFVTDEGSYPVRKQDIHGAMNNDRVTAYAFPIKGVWYACIQSVLERSLTELIGTYYFIPAEQPLAVVQPLDMSIERDFFVDSSDVASYALDIPNNHIVRARIVSYPTRKNPGIVSLIEDLGAAESYDLAIEKAIAASGVPVFFSDEALDQASQLTLDTDNLANNRRDCTSNVCFTIDPADARDFDDAIYAKELAGGGFQVDVHIADVSHYVHWQDPIDMDAQKRAFSAYLVDRVIPMLPEELSCNLCSLVPHEKRFAMSCTIKLNDKGHVSSFDVYRSLITSKARLVYGDVDAYLQGKTTLSDMGVQEAYQGDIAQALKTLRRVMELRQALHKRRGAIAFETVENRVELDDAGKPIGVSIRKPTVATLMVEHAMLLANECVGKLLADRDIPAAYRVHEAPDPDALWKTLPILHEVGLLRDGEGSQLVCGSPFAIQDVLGRVQGTSSEYVVNTLLLRSQARAVYRPHNEGHFALGADDYCHFTSPIRRYPDVIVHRKLKAYLDNKLKTRMQTRINRRLNELCVDCSHAERRTAALGRETQKIKLAEMYADRIGESARATITGVTSYGLFVMVDDTYAEGLIPVRDIDEWFIFDEVKMCLIGEDTHTTYRLGQRLDVVVKSVTIERGHITFALPHKN